MDSVMCKLLENYLTWKTSSQVKQEWMRILNGQVLSINKCHYVGVERGLVDFHHHILSRSRNSDLVFGSSRKVPLIQEVMVLLSTFWTPLERKEFAKRPVSRYSQHYKMHLHFCYGTWTGCKWWLKGIKYTKARFYGHCFSRKVQFSE